MLRTLCLVVIALLAVCLCADLAWAQANTWPEFPLDPNDPNVLPRGPGSYFQLDQAGARHRGSTWSGSRPAIGPIATARLWTCRIRCGI